MICIRHNLDLGGALRCPKCEKADTTEAAFEVKYEAGHFYRETWGKTEYHCPRCGVKDVWHETSGEDYYVGETHLCLSCKARFYLPDEPTDLANNWQDKQRIEAILKHIKGE